MEKKKRRNTGKLHLSNGRREYRLPERMLALLLAFVLVLTSGGMQQIMASEVAEDTETVADSTEVIEIDDTEIIVDYVSDDGDMIALDVEEESEPETAEADLSEASGSDGILSDVEDLLTGTGVSGVEDTENGENCDDFVQYTEEVSEVSTQCESDAQANESGDSSLEATTEAVAQNGNGAQASESGNSSVEAATGAATQNESNDTASESEKAVEEATGANVQNESNAAESESEQVESESVGTVRYGYKSSSVKIVAQGTSFYDLTWTLDSEGMLTISGGTGQDYDIICNDDDWADYKDSVISVVIEDGVTEIYSFAFEEYTNLVSITIPESVTEIGPYVFYGCTSLKTATILANITELGYQSFYGCTSLTTVTLPEGLKTIGGSVFVGCSNLKSINIPSTVTEIGEYAFYGCVKLSGITIPSGVSEISSFAFYGCTGLTSVTIPGNVKTIGDYAFCDCSALSSITISSGVQKIGEWAFYGCTSLTGITVPSSVTSLGKYAFCGCTSLKKAELGTGLTEVSDSLFAGCTKLSSVTLPSGIKTIGDYAFDGCSSLKSITIPSTVTSIGMYAFSECSKLSGITIPSKVTSIGEGAFYKCKKLTEITIPASVTSLGSNAFNSCTSLKTVKIKKGLKSIKEATFYGCSKLSSVTLPSSITSIGNSAFYNCSALSGITLPSGLKTLSDYAFYGCSSLEAITIPAKVTTIGSCAFEYCESLCYLYIKDGVKKIDTFAFDYCTSLIIVRIPKSVTTIGNYAFDCCESLVEVYYGSTKTKWSSISIGTNNTYLENATFTYSSTTSVVIPQNEVTELQIISSGIKVRWTQSYGAKGYYVYRKTGSGSYKKIATIKSGSTLYYTDKSVSKNNTYTYKVRAYSGSTKSAYASAKSIKFLKGTVKTVSNPTASESFNDGDQNYYYFYVDSSDSYLVAVDGGFMRVEYVDGVVAVEYYNSKWKLTSKKTITCELDIFGGFYAGEDAYYLVFGQSNPSESDSTEVIRVVKYSTSWKRQSNASLYGANTTIPFEFGNLSMTEYGGYLYIHTCHEMYTWIDGLNHQANMTIEVKESDMTITDSYYDISNNSTGYVSHSFNQRIMVDDSGNLITADHSDAVPRAMIIIKYNTKAGNSTFNGDVSSVKTFTFKGDTGENYTGATLGGLEYSSSSYILAGSSVKQNSKWSSNSQYNIFVTVTSRSDFTSSGTSTKWITSYSEGSDVDVSNPQLVKISNKKFLLMWTENTTTLKYVFLDAKGNTTTSIYSVTAGLSDCQPIYSNGYVYWYTTGSYTEFDYSKPTLYAINVKSPTKVYASTGSLSVPTINSVSNVSSGVKITWTGSLNATGYIIYRKTGSGSYTQLKKITSNKTVSYTDKTAKSGTKYTYKILAYTKSGSTTKKSSYSSEKSINYLAAGKISSLTNTSKGITIKWSKVSKATGYYVYRKTSSGSYKKIATIKKNSTTSYTDTAVKSKNGTTYIYKVVPYNSSTKGSSVSKTTVRLTGTTLSSVKNSASKKITVKWSKASKVTGYQIQYSTSSSFASGNKKVTVTSASTTSKVIGSLTKGKKYYVRIRTYKTVSDTKYYSAWSSKKSVKVSK